MLLELLLKYFCGVTGPIILLKQVTYVREYCRHAEVCLVCNNVKVFPADLCSEHHTAPFSYNASWCHPHVCHPHELEK